MSNEQQHITDAINQQFFMEFPAETAREIERADSDLVIEMIQRMPAGILAPVWQKLLPEKAARLLMTLPEATIDSLIEALPAAPAVRILQQLPKEVHEAIISGLGPRTRDEIASMMTYPPDSAGRLMDGSVSTYRRSQTVGQALAHLRSTQMKTARSLILVDDNHVVTGKVSLQALALADPGSTLGELEEPLIIVLRPIDPVSEVTRAFETHNVLDIPIVDLDGVFLGAITHGSIAKTIQAQSSLDMQSMVGASREERALSSPFFTVRKRMPWLQVNLLTAFMAAAVVGIFENTIAQVTALAVLLPVVAGQSGNTGAQALAVTMRGLALREITIRQWLKVTRKEVLAGLMNGVGIAVTCGIGVYIWSGSLPLVAVIASSMVMAMVAAGFAGAVIPIILTRLGQDPATSSSILLTTVTDIAGFFSFLGIATLFMRFL